MSKILPVLIAVFFTVVLTWPLLPNISSFYSDQGDYPLNGAVLWYNYDSIKTGRIFHSKEYWQGFQFYPQPYSLSLASNLLSGQVVFAPLYWITNKLVFSVNMYVFLSFFLSFLSAYYTIRYFTKNSWASLIGAFIFAFNPQTLVRFPQHIDLLSKFYLPLVFLFGFQLLERPDFKKGLQFGLFFTLNAFTHSYYQIFSITVLPILALSFFVSHIIKKDLSYFLNLFKVSLVGLIFLPLLLYFDLPVLAFSQKEGAYRSLESVPFFSARINDWFSASPDNLVYGGWVKSIEKSREPKDDRGILNYEEHTLFPGILALILFFLGLKKFQKAKINHLYFYILLLIPFILTFGPYFNGASEGFPLPFYWLYKTVPLMEGIRAPGRFEFLFYVPFSLIAAFGVLRLEGVKAHLRGVLIGGIFVLLTLENFTIKNFDDRSEALKMAKPYQQQLQGKVTLHLPIFTTDDADQFGKNSYYLNWLTQTGEKIINGNSSYLPPDHLGLLQTFIEGGSEEGLGILANLGVDYLVVHTEGGVKLVSLKGYQNKIAVCDPEKIDLKRLDEGVIVENLGDCFLLSPFDLRYRQIDKLQFRMPLVLGPKEQIFLSFEEREARIK